MFSKMLNYLPNTTKITDLMSITHVKAVGGGGVRAFLEPKKRLEFIWKNFYSRIECFLQISKILSGFRDIAPDVLGISPFSGHFWSKKRLKKWPEIFIFYANALKLEIIVPLRALDKLWPKQLKLVKNFAKNGDFPWKMAIFT